VWLDAMDSDEDTQMTDANALAPPHFAKGKGKAVDRSYHDDDNLPWSGNPIINILTVIETALQGGEIQTSDSGRCSIS